MAQVVIKWTRKDTTKDWVMATPENIRNGMFSQAEIGILTQTREVYTSLPGFMSVTNETPDANTFVTRLQFDTLEDAQSANDLFLNPPVNSSFYLRRQLMLLKRNQMGVNYQFNLEVIA